MADFRLDLRFWLRAFRSAALMSAVAVPVAPALAQGKVGVAALVENEVSGTLSGRTRTLAVGNEVFGGERVQTGSSGNAQLLFLDQTTFTIGPKADVTLDRFIFDPKRKAGSVVLETTKGAFRLISGAQGADAYQIKTPVATIGVRGSMIYGIGGPNGWIFYVGEGHGWVRQLNGNLIDNIPAGQAVFLLPNGRVIVTKFDVGELDLARLQELLPRFEDLPDNFTIDLTEALGAPGEGGGCDTYCGN